MHFWKLCRRLGFSWRETIHLAGQGKKHDLIAIQNQMPSLSIRDYYALQDREGADAILCAALCAALDTWQVYQDKGMDEGIFWDTMGMFRRFMGETQVRFGKRFFDRGWWTWRILEPRLFRLGSLEYELLDRQGEKSISLHIPSDADMTPEAVDASFSQAESFFHCHYPQWDNAPWRCHSWLLSPRLLPFLKEGSHIRAFQSRFVPDGTDDEESCLQWLFAAKPDAPLESLREDTSLQRSVKQHLLSGGVIGQGYGTVPRKIQ